MLRKSLRERLEKKRKERQEYLGTGTGGGLQEVAEEKKSSTFCEGKFKLNEIKNLKLIFQTNSIFQMLKLKNV